MDAEHDRRATLVLLAGMPGTGKTTLALAMGAALGWPVVDKDTLKSPLIEGGVPEALAGPASYALLLDVGYDLLVRQRFSVILDSPGRFPVVLERARSMARAVGGRLAIVECVASRSLRDLRLRQRAARPSQWMTDAGLSDEAEREMFDHLPHDRLALDTSRPLEECLQCALIYLERSSREGLPRE